MLALITVVKRGQANRDARYCYGLAGMFVYLSMDEGAAIHELWGTALQRLAGFDGFLRFAWVIPGSILVAAIGGLYMRFLWRLPLRTRAWFVVAGALFVGGALGVEMLGAKYASVSGRDFGFALIVTLEETLELAGVATFLLALLQHLGRESNEIRLSVAASGKLAE